MATSRGGQLSERVILDAALRLTRAIGVEQLTMRALADELGVSPMATYYYVKGRDALLLLVADEVMRPVLPPPPESGSWDQRLWDYMQAMGESLAAYPGLGDFLIYHEATPAARRYMERCIEILREGGFDADQARAAFSAIYTYMWGRSVFQAVQTRRRANGRRKARTGPLPSIDDLASGENVETGYQALVYGLEHTLLGHGTTAPSGRSLLA